MAATASTAETDATDAIPTELRKLAEQLSALSADSRQALLAMFHAPGAPPQEFTSLFGTDGINELDPTWYGKVRRELLAKMGRGEITPLAFKQARGALQEVCRDSLKCDISEALMASGTVWERVSKNILATLPTDVPLLRKEFDRVPGLDEDVKKKCRNWLEQLQILQAEARTDIVKSWIYVMRDSEGDVLPEQRDSQGDGVYHAEWFHVAFFRAWTQTKFPKVLVMAPPGHGKTTCLRWYLADKIGREPHRRFLGLYDKADKPTREIPLVARIIESPRYRAIFPGVRVLDRVDGAKRTDQQFTVLRPNWSSREPTYEGFSILSQFNGMGYDELICDDMCPPSAKQHRYIREDVWGNFTAVAQERIRNPRTAQIKMIATPWHEEDVHGRIRAMVSKGQLEGWLVLVDCFKIKDDAGGKAIPIWEGRITSDVLEQKKRFMGARYTLNYRLEASQDNMRALRRMHYYNSEPDGFFTVPGDLRGLELLRNGEKWLSIDPSATAAKWSSDQGVTEWVFTPGGFLCCTEVWFLHLAAVEMQDWLIRRLYQQADLGLPYTGIYIEAQGGMKGQCNLWVQHIPEALKSGRIPTGEGEDRTIVQMPPYKGEVPRWSLTGTRMGQGTMQNLSKMKRLIECGHLIENAWVRFAGRRVEDHRQRFNKVTYCVPVPGSPMERLQSTLFNFDGTNSADAVDSVTQFLLGFRHKMRDPNAVKHATRDERPSDPQMRAFQAAIGKIVADLGQGGPDKPDEELTFAQNAWAAA